jgi:hypothetical protein
MPTWLWGGLIWLALCVLFVARWDWSRATPPAAKDESAEAETRIDNSDLHELLGKSTAAATGVDQEQA